MVAQRQPDTSKSTGAPAPHVRPVWFLSLLLLAALAVAAASIAILRFVRHSSPESPPAQQVVIPAPTVDLPTMAPSVSVDQLHQEIETVAEQLATAYPQSSDALHTAAMIRFELLEPAQAEDLWRQCLRVAPDHLPARIGLAVLATDSGNDQEAVSTLQQALAAGYSAPEIYHRLGIALSQLGRLDQAERILDEALARFPLAAELHLLLGQTRIQQNKIDQAVENLVKAVSLSPDRPNAYLSLATAYTRLGKTAEAAESRKRFTELKPLAVPVQPEFQSTFLATLRQIAVNYFPQAARIHADRGDPKGAETLLLRAISLAPERPYSLALLAAIYQQTGQLANARAVLLRRLQIDSHDLQAWLDLAAVSSQLEDFPGAEEAYQQVLHDRPDSIEAYNGLASVYLRQQQFDRARSLAEEGIRWQPTAEGYRILAEILAQTGDQSGAVSPLP